MFAPQLLPTDIICEKHNFRGIYCVQCENERLVQQGRDSVLNEWNHVSLDPKRNSDYYCLVQIDNASGFSQYHKVVKNMHGVWVLNDNEKVVFWRELLPDPINQ